MERGWPGQGNAVVIPIHDTNPVRRTPVVTYLLLLINIGAFLASPIAFPVLGPGSAAEACQDLAFFQQYAAVPSEVTSGEPLREVATGRVQSVRGDEVACEGTTRPPYDKSPVLSVLTAMFLHGGWLHLLGNMLYLFVFGNNVEDRLGRLRFLSFYLLAGYVATYVYAFAFPSVDTTLVGASGAIAGVLGAYLVLFPRARVTSLVPFLFFLPFRLPAWLVLGSWFVLQYVYARGAGLTDSPGGGVAYLAHVAGFVAGVLLLLPFLPRLRRRAPQPYRY